MDASSLISTLDDQIGERLESTVVAHHARRLGRLGWGGALTSTGAREWWVPHVPVRHGNSLRVLIDGAQALPEIERAIAGAQRSVHIAGWHVTPHFRLTDDPEGPTLREVLARAAERVPVRVLLWAGPPLPLFSPTRHEVQEVRDTLCRNSLVQCELDKRERTMHCHHEKIVVVDDELAFVGGIDLTDLHGNRNDDSDHPAEQSLGWHDCATVMRGPVVRDVAEHFRQRWSEIAGELLPEPPEQPVVGSVAVQLLRTVPEGTYDFAPKGVFTILDGYLRALRAAESLIYIENQFLWSPEVVDILVAKLLRPPSPEFRMVLVLPKKPNNGKDTTRGQLGRLIGADHSEQLLATTVLGSTLESPGVYVHAKVAVIDDRWLTVGSANLNEHSLFNDTEVNVLTCDRELARDTRLRLWEEHTRRPRAELDGPAHEVVDRVWGAIAEEQARLSERGLPPTHRIRRITGLSKRVDRLQGPLRGLLVDG
ncbi:MAG: phospholipase D family protein [Actinomycetota bacterium]|nr:phospholipase D family protein [Actinomycetota bacterium]